MLALAVVQCGGPKDSQQAGRMTGTQVLLTVAVSAQTNKAPVQAGWAQQGTAGTGHTAHQGQVPVDEGPIAQRMPPANIERKIGEAAPHDGEV